MQYFGGKYRIALQITDYLKNVRKPNQTFLEPMCGGLNITSKMDGKIIACDYNEYLIELYKAIQNGYDLPNSISEDEYKYIKLNKDLDKTLTGFVGFGCSYAGKWFGGYARDNNGRNYCLNAKKSLLKKYDSLKNVEFIWCDYKTLSPENYLIYCDPPYKNTTKFTGTPNFDTDEFWDIMRKWSKNNDVYISEYEAPDDFICVLEINTKTDIRNKNNKLENRTERLYTYNTEIKCK